MFVPVHELAHQICILNAYMRESELVKDGLHPTLWAVLDEMIDMHKRLEPKSLFGGQFMSSINQLIISLWFTKMFYFNIFQEHSNLSI